VTGTLPPATPDCAATRGRYPDELERTWQPAGAPAVRIRALRQDDLDLERRFVTGLSPATLYLRLQYFTTEPSERDLARLLDLDYHDRLAVAALAPSAAESAAGPEIVGVARYARLDNSRTAECAIVVADAWQGLGLGSELMRSLAAAALDRDIDDLEGTTLAENQRIVEWARRFGFAFRTEPNSGGLVKVTLHLRDVSTDKL
jgi:acetyltransferase